MPPAQLGSFPKLIDPDEYEGKFKFKCNVHYNPTGLAALATFLQEKCINAHFAKMVEDAKEAGLPIVGDIGDCESPADWLEGKLKEPHEKDKVQLPKLQVHVDADRKLKDGTVERRVISFWDAKGKVISPEKLKRMSAGTWVQPVVHPNLFLSKQLGKAPRCQLQLVGLQIIQLVEFGSNDRPPSAADEDEMRRIMGADYAVDDDLAGVIGGGALADGLDDEDPF